MPAIACSDTYNSRRHSCWRVIKKVESELVLGIRGQVDKKGAFMTASGKQPETEQKLEFYT